jgi:hypothetical protein
MTIPCLSVRPVVGPYLGTSKPRNDEHHGQASARIAALAFSPLRWTADHYRATLRRRNDTTPLAGRLNPPNRGLAYNFDASACDENEKIIPPLAVKPWFA